ncbi:MAG: DUF1295 domain-containing protein [Candidatus Abyssobacteria bacterium SURF_17]|jgi:steroid 5-alpha reductase family enzyme|uniref:DUF1295 domain-containing protein n=1 Tax=Candidatus Abyssobacteria bacterium SURF_17 TaxID=2093361 RepID=A0A419ERI7_9BACT|nr:MAG: DUF1295 domain-containing protein [Candidatus Abyssubacteria bacterium SURF_17]
MTPAWAVFGTNLAAAMALMFCVWLLSVAKKDASIVDIFWGLGFVVIAWLSFAQADGYWGREVLISLLTTAWGLRLAVHIAFRNRGKGEDPRYRTMREKHGDRFWWVSLFTVFGLQALLLWVISLVVQIGQLSKTPEQLVWLDIVGACVWAVGFFFESVGDWQLARFTADPANKSKLLTRGLWAYTRHPNYFGESLVWWGMFLIALATPYGLWAIISPLVITFLLLRVSGVPLLEESMLAAQPEYRSYAERTRAFIPWFPKKEEKKS